MFVDHITMLTTKDNPFDPFEQFDSWLRFDMDKGYNSCSYLARIAKTSDQLTEKENAIHAIKTGLDKKDSCYKPVYQYDLNGNFIRGYKSITEAFMTTGAQTSNINKVINGERRSAGGFKWSFLKVDNLNN